MSDGRRFNCIRKLTMHKMPVLIIPRNESDHGHRVHRFVLLRCPCGGGCLLPALRAVHGLLRKTSERMCATLRRATTAMRAARHQEATAHRCARRADIASPLIVNSQSSGFLTALV